MALSPRGEMERPEEEVAGWRRKALPSQKLLYQIRQMKMLLTNSSVSLSRNVRTTGHEPRLRRVDLVDFVNFGLSNRIVGVRPCHPQARTGVVVRDGNTLKGFEAFCLERGSRQGQKLALTAVFDPYSLDSGLPGGDGGEPPP